MSEELLHVRTGLAAAGGGYDIHVGGGALSRAGELLASVTPSRRAAIVTDSNVAKLYAGKVREILESAGFSAPVFAFPAGEKSKNLSTLADIYTFLAENELTRADTVVALGGGVPGDTAGFAAATWQRGIRLMQIPTTLLAQVDSSVGGKTAVDLEEGKNLVGAFWQPSLVVCDPDTLVTLDKKNLACGMAEIIKHACIRDAAMFSELETLDLTAVPPAGLIARNIGIKRAVVERDERERGERMLLNFGHTLGHAVEKLSFRLGVTHGHCVAAGMAMITRASERRGLTEKGTSARLEKLLGRAALPTGTDLDIETVLDAVRADKKRSGDDINLVVLERIGSAHVMRMPLVEFRSFMGL
jgi:3-dehydroquinate synthase